ncbi:hypothetical protein HII36_44275 [Nonomuraea sp. NN258]|uniref:hypothetical protein n=1 Tax=Nonomuraea antri TaxID=2730852 RepID=UPI001567E232|nr:hypothetical protein [Nonomuraea antri]NRQ38794.1 hypothetical protein [Nonomuraea antri]
MAVLDGIALPPRWHITSRLVAGWPIDDQHLLELWPYGRTDDARFRWFYRLSRRNRTIFTGTDITSPARALLTTDALISAALAVLNVLTLQPGDTDAEHFAADTRTQADWRERFAEPLSLYALEDVCGYCGADHPSPSCGKE